MASRRRLAASLSSLAVAVSVFAVVAPVDASVSVAQRYVLPASGNIPVTGHGYGHGHGMSQYGAEGAARQGLTARQIVAFYYPGTAIATFMPNIAVLISADTSRDTQVLTQAGLRVRDRGTGAAYTLPSVSAKRWRLNVSAASGKSVVDYFTDRWYRWKELVGDGELSATSGVLRLITPAGPRSYRGVLRGNRPSPTSTDRDTVNVLGIDDYVRGVVPAEMPASWTPAAVQAQAIAARSYAIFERADHLDRHYQICDTSACQVYRGIAGEHPDSNRAVAATAGLYLTYGGKPAFTQFSASSGGWTSQGSQPYLPRKSDPYDDWSGNGVHTWSTAVNESRLEARYPGIGDLRSITITRREGGGDWQGRVESMTLAGAKGTRTITGDDFRSAYGLRSRWFKLG